mmetsp:Transcript_11658/g.32867  ORF Transcript_11658/g.32867 Transcript_11658/m.32867 type:complete len:292 (+) Transcript_11658:68-943(+)
MKTIHSDVVSCNANNWSRHLPAIAPIRLPAAQPRFFLHFDASLSLQVTSIVPKSSHRRLDFMQLLINEYATHSDVVKWILQRDSNIQQTSQRDLERQRDEECDSEVRIFRDVGPVRGKEQRDDQRDITPHHGTDTLRRPKLFHVAELVYRRVQFVHHVEQHDRPAVAVVARPHRLGNTIQLLDPPPNLLLPGRSIKCNLIHCCLVPQVWVPCRVEPARQKVLVHARDHLGDGRPRPLHQHARLRVGFVRRLSVRVLIAAIHPDLVNHPSRQEQKPGLAVGEKVKALVPPLL